jgi:hypothetical protein
LCWLEMGRHLDVLLDVMDVERRGVVVSRT